MNMTEPCSTGIGGDMFCLFFDARTKRVSALNGSGRSGARFTLERIEESLGAGAQTKTKTGGRAGGGGEGGKKMPSKIPAHCPHAVTVPGAAAGWVDTVERFGSGKLGMREILAPAIALGEKGFVVSELAAYYVGLLSVLWQ
jgi:gamma-glutamyltranspeptidase/glutathione hydrolase